MYEDNQAVQETCTIVKNMPNDNGELYIQVFNSKGNMIAIDMKEFKRQIEQQEQNVKFYVEQREKGIKELEEQRREFNRVRQKWDNDFTKLKETVEKQKNWRSYMIVETLKHVQVLLKTAKRSKGKDEAARFFKELNNDLIEKYINGTVTVGPQQVKNTI
jgi:DNA repair exonuclease SbcCD ATPase subunit